MHLKVIKRSFKVNFKIVEIKKFFFKSCSKLISNMRNSVATQHKARWYTISIVPNADYVSYYKFHNSYMSISFLTYELVNLENILYLKFVYFFTFTNIVCTSDHLEMILNKYNHVLIGRRG